MEFLLLCAAYKNHPSPPWLEWQVNTRVNQTEWWTTVSIICITSKTLLQTRSVFVHAHLLPLSAACSPPATLMKSSPDALYTSMYLLPMWCLCLFSAISRCSWLINRTRASPFRRPWGLKHKATPPLQTKLKRWSCPYMHHKDIQGEWRYSSTHS